MKTLVITLLLVFIALLLLSFRVLFVKGGKFPQGHAHNLPGLRKNKRKK